MPEGHHHHRLILVSPSLRALSLLNACSAHCLPRVLRGLLPKWLLFVCLTPTEAGSDQRQRLDRQPHFGDFGFRGFPSPLLPLSFSFLPPCIFVAFNFSLIVKIFILICAFCTFCLCPLSLSLSVPLSHLANLTTGVGWRYKRVALVWLDCPNNSYIKVIRGY